VDVLELCLAKNEDGFDGLLCLVIHPALRAGKVVYVA
jgi:hypothetical protein